MVWFHGNHTKPTKDVKVVPSVSAVKVSAVVYAGETQVANTTLPRSSAGIYAGSCAMGAAGTYDVEIIVQGTVLARFAVTLDGINTPSPGSNGELGPIPSSLIYGSAASGLALLGVGMVVRKRAAPKDCTN